MRCPRCEGVVLDEREREGVVIDKCPTCYGVWLDRGELEKLMDRSARYQEKDRGRSFDRDDDDDDDRRRSYENDRRRDSDHQGSVPYGHPQKKRGFFESFGDLFD